MSLLVAILLGIVEGLTEYLPVSSTGHLILVSQILGETSEGAKAFDIVIQLGAILAVVVHYRRLLGARVAGLLRRDVASVRLAVALSCSTAAARPSATSAMYLSLYLPNSTTSLLRRKCFLMA